MSKSPTLDKLIPALIAAQRAVKNAKKNCKNPHFKSGYADLDSVLEASKDPLLDNGLVVSFMLDQCDGKPALKTIIMHESGQWMESVHTIVAAKMDAQGIMGYVTYAKRYGLSSALGITCDDDDDGETSQGRGKHEDAKPKKEEPVSTYITPKQLELVKDFCKKIPDFESRIKSHFKINDLSKIPLVLVDEIIQNANHQISKQLKSLESEVIHVAM